MFNDQKLTNKRIQGQIKSISTRSKSLRESIQSTACEIAAHAYQHGDVTLYNALFKAAKGSDRVALSTWIQGFGFATMRSDGSFGLNKKAVEEADYADAQEVFDAYTDKDTLIPTWYSLTKSASAIAAALNPAAMLLKLAADIGKHSDPDSDIADDKRRRIELGKSGEIEAAMQQVLKNVATAQGRINTNEVPQLQEAA